MKNVFAPIDVKINNDPKVWGTNIGKTFGDKVEIKNKKIPNQTGYTKGAEKIAKPKKVWHFKAPAPYNRHLCRSCAAFTIFTYLAIVAAFATLTVNEINFENPTPWAYVGIIMWVVAGFGAIALALFIPLVVREFKLMLHRQDLKGSLLLNLFNIVAAILAFSFLITIAVKGVQLTHPVGDWQAVAKMCIDIGIMAVITFYMNQYSFMAKNKRYLDASGALRTKRALLFTIGITGLFVIAALAWWNGMGFNGNNPQGGWRGLHAYLSLQTLSVLGGAVTLLLIAFVVFSVFVHSNIEKDPQIIKHTIVNSIFGGILFVLMVIVADKRTIVILKDFGSTGCVVIDEIYGILCFTVGIMAFAQSKLVARKPKAVAAK